MRQRPRSSLRPCIGEGIGSSSRSPLRLHPFQVPSLRFQVWTLSTQDSALCIRLWLGGSRHAELAQLYQWLEKAVSGERQIVFVTGEPGIGKTALVEAFRQRLEASDWRPIPSPQASSLKPLASPVRFAHGQCIEHYGAGEA